jgi:hypothetical protein
MEERSPIEDRSGEMEAQKEDGSWEIEDRVEGMKNEHRKERISSFEDLEAWQMARQLVNSLYRLTRLKSLATDFRLCSQVQAAGVSIMSNIWACEVL